MPKYLTTAQYRSQDDYPLTPDITDLTLARMIQRAESEIDAYMEFSLLTGGFEPHTLWVEAQWDPQTRRLRMPIASVPVRRALRYQIQVANLSNTGAPFVAIINNQDIAFNIFDEYVEIVPLTSITYSLAPVLTALGLNPPIIQFDCEVGHFLPTYTETLYPLSGQDNSGAASNTFVAMRGFWASTYTQALSIQPQTLPPVPPVVYKAGVPQFSAALSAPLTAGTAYTSLPVSGLAQAVTAGTVLLINDGSGQTALSVTVAAPGASVGATALPVNSFTPTVSYPVGTVFAAGYSVNYAEGQVVFSPAYTAGLPTCDYTYTIPDNVRSACIDQVSYLLGKRALNKQGMAGLAMARNGDVEIRTIDSYPARFPSNVGALCDSAAHKLENYIGIPVA